MKDLIITLFGSYEPVMTTVTDEVLGSVQMVASGMAGVAWEWISGVVLFAIVLYSFLRLVGVLLRG